MKWLLSIGFILLMATAAHAQVTRIVAVVNNDIVTGQDVNARLNLIMRTSGIPDTPQNRAQLRPRVLQNLINEKLEMQEAARYKISVSKSAVDRALANIEERNHMPKGGLDAYLKANGIPISTLVNQVTATLTWNKLVQERYSMDVSVSDTEVKDEIARIKADFGKPESHVAEIFLAVNNPTQAPKVKTLADRLIEQIRAGANFAALAEQFSQSPSAATGGDIGWVTPNQFGPPLDEAIAKMNPGQISYPIRTPAGYYIFYLLQRRTLGKDTPNDAELGLVEVIFPLSPSATAQEQQRVTAKAQQVTDTAKGCDDMAKIARKEAPRLSTQIPNVRAGDLEPDLRKIVLALKIGQPSKPIPARGGIGVVMVCRRTNPPPPVPSTEEVYNLLMRQRMDQMARRYLDDLRRSAYIDIRDEQTASTNAG